MSAHFTISPDVSYPECMQKYIPPSQPPDDIPSQLVPPDPDISFSLNPNQTGSIATAMLSVPFEFAPVTFPSLEKLTLTQLCVAWNSMLTNHPEDCAVIDIPSQISEFTDEEDFYLLTAIRCKNCSQLNRLLRPIHSKGSIKQRIHQLKGATPEEHEIIYQKYQQQLFKEELAARDLSDSCLYNPYPHFPSSQETNDEIEAIMSDRFRQFCTTNLFHVDDLAMFRSTDKLWMMRCQSIIIGKNSRDSMNDIDLNLISECPCKHNSKSQAIVWMHENCKFWIRNFGSLAFRVNGIEIPPLKCTQLHPYSILDFHGALLMFIPNTAGLDKLLDEYKAYRS